MPGAVQLCGRDRRFLAEAQQKVFIGQQKIQHRHANSGAGACAQVGRIDARQVQEPVQVRPARPASQARASKARISAFSGVIAGAIVKRALRHSP